MSSTAASHQGTDRCLRLFYVFYEYFYVQTRRPTLTLGFYKTESGTPQAAELAWG